MEPLTRPDKRVWAVVFGVVAAAIAGTFTRNEPLFAWAVSIAAVVASVIGWQLARRRYFKLALARIHTEIEAMGGLDGFIDQTGREMLTVWIPLDHDVTGHDRRFATRLGESLRNHIPCGVAGFVALESSVGKVGVVLRGRDADNMLEGIRPFFKQHCPRGTYVTRWRFPRENDSGIDFPDWAWRKPLFEDDELPETSE